MLFTAAVSDTGQSLHDDGQADRTFESLHVSSPIGVGEIDREIIDRGALKLAFLGRGLRDLEHAGECVLERFTVFQSDGEQHALAIVLDRFLEVADDCDQIAQGPEEIVLETQRLAALWTH